MQARVKVDLKPLQLTGAKAAQVPEGAAVTLEVGKPVAPLEAQGTVVVKLSR